MEKKEVTPNYKSVLGRQKRKRVEICRPDPAFSITLSKNSVAKS